VTGGHHLVQPFTVEEGHGLVFHTVLPEALFLTNCERSGPEGAVVKEDRVFVQAPMGRQRAS
jgi:hypothetical protein